VPPINSRPIDTLLAARSVISRWTRALCARTVTSVLARLVFTAPCHTHIHATFCDTHTVCLSVCLSPGYLKQLLADLNQSWYRCRIHFSSIDSQSVLGVNTNWTSWWRMFVTFWRGKPSVNYGVGGGFNSPSAFSFHQVFDICRRSVVLLQTNQFDLFVCGFVRDTSDFSRRCSTVLVLDIIIFNCNSPIR